ncbi:MAG: glycosyltransferase [Candidatus Saccharibacteria bacterium]|nr:glycosyltransferase [Candidatus Saccharibacteria bacterium]
MKPELISILMPVYNIQSQAYLKQAIDSILNQTYPHFELLLTDDGSSNSSYRWAKALTKHDPRVKLSRNPKNLGLTKTLNQMLAQAQGKYIARMDADDYCPLDRLEKQLHFLKTHPNYQLISANLYYFNNRGVWKTNTHPAKIKKQDFLFNSPIEHAAILATKSAFTSVGGYSEKWYATRVEDYELFMRMFKQGIKMYTIQEPLYYYRVDQDHYKKSKYRYRFNEAIVRFLGFKSLGLLPQGLPYVFKPLIVGLLPKSFVRHLQKKLK